VVSTLELSYLISNGEGLNPVDWFNAATLSCLSLARSWISYVICRGLFLCSVSSVNFDTSLLMLNLSALFVPFLSRKIRESFSFSELTAKHLSLSIMDAPTLV
jgi:hypothetical protein